MKTSLLILIVAIVTVVYTQFVISHPQQFQGMITEDGSLIYKDWELMVRREAFLESEKMRQKLQSQINYLVERVDDLEEESKSMREDMEMMTKDFTESMPPIVAPPGETFVGN